MEEAPPDAPDTAGQRNDAPEPSVDAPTLGAAKKKHKRPKDPDSTIYKKEKRPAISKEAGRHAGQSLINEFLRKSQREMDVDR